MAVAIKPHKHLINIIKSTNNPNFTLFLGAGTSVSSGVSPAGVLIQQWRNIYSEMYPLEDISKKSWYDTATEYSELFELLYDQPSQRREFIESCIKDALPSWGYIYLANLLKNNIFNTIFTTNFDDLINEACYSFSTDLKPLVSAHDSSITSVRLTSPRPKIIKLHGDFLFDNIKNTVRELESLEDNMRAKFKQYASEFGMIVIGYSGNDRSIMETLNTLLRYDHNFPHGIYWCVRKGTKIDSFSKELEDLTRFPRFHLIEINGFDEFLADIHNELGLSIQDEVSRPYHHLANRLDNFVSRNGVDDGDEHEHEVINSDINKLKDNIQRIHSAIEVVEKVEKLLIENSDDKVHLAEALKQLAQEIKPIKAKLTGEIHLISTPNILLAEFEYRDENYTKSKILAKKAINSRITITAVTIYIKSLNKLNSMDDFEWAIKKLSEVASMTDKDAHRLNSTAVELIDSCRYSEGLKILQLIKIQNLSSNTLAFIRLNQALILKLQNKYLDDTLQEDLVLDLEHAIERSSHWLTFGLSLILGKDDVASEMIENLDEDQLLVALHKSQPIMELISESLYEKLSIQAQKVGIAGIDENDDHSEISDHNLLDSNGRATIDEALIKDNCESGKGYNQENVVTMR